MEEQWRKREEDLKEVPPKKATPDKWPRGVRTIGLDEMNALGVDATGTLYWHGKSVAVRRIELRLNELVILGIGAVGALLSGLVAIFPKLPNLIECIFKWISGAS